MDEVNEMLPGDIPDTMDGIEIPEGYIPCQFCEWELMAVGEFPYGGCPMCDDLHYVPDGTVIRECRTCDGRGEYSIPTGNVIGCGTCGGYGSVKIK